MSIPVNDALKAINTLEGEKKVNIELTKASGARDLDFTPKSKQDLLKEAMGLQQEQAIDKSDIVIPQIVILQANSQLVMDGTFKVKDIIDVSTKEVLGNDKEPVEIIPILFSKSIKVEKNVGDSKRPKWEYDQRITNVSESVEKEWRETAKKNPETIKVYLHYDFLCLLPKHPTVPYLIRCKGMAHGAAKAFIRSAFIAANSEKRPSYSKSFMMGMSLAKYLDSSAYVFDFKPSNKKVSDDLIIDSFKWYKLFRDGLLVASEDEDVQEKPRREKEVVDSDVTF